MIVFSVAEFWSWFTGTLAWVSSVSSDAGGLAAKLMQPASGSAARRRNGVFMSLALVSGSFCWPISEPAPC